MRVSTFPLRLLPWNLLFQAAVLTAILALIVSLFCKTTDMVSWSVKLMLNLKLTFKVEAQIYVLLRLIPTYTERPNNFKKNVIALILMLSLWTTIASPGSNVDVIWTFSTWCVNSHPFAKSWLYTFTFISRQSSKSMQDGKCENWCEHRQVQNSLKLSSLQKL